MRYISADTADFFLLFFFLPKDGARGEEKGSRARGDWRGLGVEAEAGGAARAALSVNELRVMGMCCRRRSGSRRSLSLCAGKTSGMEHLHYCSSWWEG